MWDDQQSLHDETGPSCDQGVLAPAALLRSPLLW